jgi:hypothetical protein
MSIRDRIRALERRLPVHDPEPPFIVRYVAGPPENDPPDLGPIEGWLMVREQLALPMEPGTRAKIVCADAFEEYERRNALPAGILSTHPLHGHIAFDELLRAATGQNCTESGAFAGDPDE